MKKEEVNNIVKRIQNGETELLHDFIKDNMEVIYNITKKYYNVFDDYEDLVQIGIEAFIKSIYSYNFKGYFLKQYSTLRMHRTVRRYVLSNLDRITNKKKRFELVKYYYKNCKNYLGGNPSCGEIAQYYGIEINCAKQIHCIYFKKDIYMNLEDYKNYYEDYSLEEVEREVSSDNFKDSIKRSGSLSGNQKDILLYRYGFLDNKYHTLLDYAKRRKITKQAASMSEQIALTKLRIVKKR